MEGAPCQRGRLALRRRSLPLFGRSTYPGRRLCPGVDGDAVVCRFDEAGITELLLAPGALGVRGISGTRNLQDNLSDLKAQVAANTKGIALVKGLIQEYSLEMVQAYMGHIQDNAERAVREMLVDFSLSCGLPEVTWRPVLGWRRCPGALSCAAAHSNSRDGCGCLQVGTVTAEDQMDDGTPIKLAVTIDRRGGGSATFDFQGATAALRHPRHLPAPTPPARQRGTQLTRCWCVCAGTGPQVLGNTNAPPAVTHSAIIYAMRCMVTRDIPLNHGCMAPITVQIPQGECPPARTRGVYTLVGACPSMSAARRGTGHVAMGS